MKVKTTTEMANEQTWKIAPVQPALNSKFSQMVSDESHHLLTTPEVNPLIQIKPSSIHLLPSGQALHAYKLPVIGGLAEQDSSDFTAPPDSLLTQMVPILEKSVNGCEWAFAPYDAFEAWRDPKRKGSLKPILDTAEAAYKLAEKFKSQLPKKIALLLPAIGIFFKVEDKVYVAYRKLPLSTAGDKWPSGTDRKPSP